VDENRTLSQLNGLRTFQWIVTTEENAVRLDAFLARRLASFSRRERTLLIAERRVLLNGEPAHKGTTVQAQDCVTVSLPLAATPSYGQTVTVEYKDNAIIIVNKPAGMPSVALRHSDAHTVANFLITHFPETAEAGARPLEAGLVHRLDTDTSGILLAARAPLAYATLREQFRRRLVGKYYLALVEGVLERDGQVQFPLEPTGPRGQHMRVATRGRGREAFTKYTPLEQLPHHTIVRLTIQTGVRHQIRIHLAALGHPIVGDKLYGATSREAVRLCLHAETLAFRHPETGKKFNVTTSLPGDFLAVLDQLRDTSTTRTSKEQER